MCPCLEKPARPSSPSDQATNRPRTDYEKIFEATPDPVVVARSTDWRIVLVNQAFCEVSGYTLGEVIGRTPLELGLWPNPDEIERCVEILNRAGRFTNLEMTLRLKGGDHPFLLSAAKVSYDGDACFVTIARDITEQRKLQSEALAAQAELSVQVAKLRSQQRLLRKEMVEREKAQILQRQSEANLRKIFETSPEAITINRLHDGVFVETNGEFARCFGYESYETLGRSVVELNIWSDDNQHNAFVREVREQGGVRDREFELRARDGRLVPVLVSAVVVEIDGDPCVLGILRDISVRKFAMERLAENEQALRKEVAARERSEAKFRKMFEANLDLVAINDWKTGRYLEINDEGVRLLGYSRDEIIGRTDQELGIWPEEALTGYIEQLDEHREVRDFDVPLRAKDGHLVPCHSSGTIVYLDGRKCCLSIARDVTEIKRTENALRKAQEAASGHVLRLERSESYLRKQIAEREKTEQKLRQSEAFVRKIIETTPDSITVNRVSDYVFTLVNEGFSKQTGFSREEALGTSMTALGLWADLARARELTKQLFEDSVIKAEEMVLRRKDGTIYPCLISAVITEIDSQPCIVGVTRDITQLKHSEDRLREREETLRKVLDTTTDIIATVRLSDGIMVEANPAIEELGYKREELIGKPWTDRLWADDDNAGLKSFFDALLSHSVIRNVETLLRRGDGTPMPVLLSAATVLIGDEKYAVVNTRDITGLKDAERRLRESEATLRKVFELNSDPMSIVDQATNRIIDVNQEFLRFYDFDDKRHAIGRQPAEVAGMVPDEFREMMFRLQRDGQIRNLECKFPDKDHRLVPMLFSATTMELAGRPCLVTTARDISALKETERKLADNELMLRTIFDTSTDTITINRMSDGVYLSVNEAFVRLSGYSREETLGRTPTELGIWAEPAQLKDLMRRSRTAPMIPRHEFTARRKNGETLTCELSAVAATIGGGPCLITITRDIGELIAARETALAASRAKSEFLSSMSHEIRTPMNAIVGMAELLSRSSLSVEQSRYLSIMKSNGDALLDLINDILDLAKIESGRLKLDKSDFSLEELFDGLGELMSVRAHEKGLELALRIADRVPLFLSGDQLRLRQILINLVGNAIKFTQAGQVVVEVERLPCAREAQLGIVSEEQEITLRFVVRDTGIGIPEDKLGSIFSSFEQADSSTTRLYGGSGLGLAIVKRLVELYRGEISVESVVGEGTCFAFTAGFQPSEAIPRSPAAPVEQLRDVRALVVDDTSINRLVLRESLERVGAKVEEAQDGIAALAALERAHRAGRPFTLLLVDGRMPAMDGVELVKRIEEIYKAEPPALLMLTSDDQPRKVAQLREAGIENYLVKPVRRAELMAAIGRALSAVHGQRSSIEPSVTATNDYADLSPLHVLVVDESQRIRSGAHGHANAGRRRLHRYPVDPVLGIGKPKAQSDDYRADRVGAA